MRVYQYSSVNSSQSGTARVSADGHPYRFSNDPIRYEFDAAGAEHYAYNSTDELAVEFSSTLPLSLRVASAPIDIDPYRYYIFLTGFANCSKNTIGLFKADDSTISAGVNTMVSTVNEQAAITMFVNFWNSVPRFKAIQVGTSYVVLSSMDPWGSYGGGGYGVTCAPIGALLTYQSRCYRDCRDLVGRVAALRLFRELVGTS